MKKISIIASIIIASISTNIFANVTTTCHMPNISFKHDKNKKYDWFSDHSVSIINDTGNTQTYHVIYGHDLPNVTEPAPKQFDVSLDNGQGFNNSERYNTKITLSVKGTYSSRAYTEIYLNGNRVSNCVSKNVLNVF